jgi:uncharacterized protein (DUF1810 family)
MTSQRTDDPFDLQRFVDAQADTYDAACRELAAGRKRSHWMWFVFPQLAGLGSSPTAQFYGIGSRAEALAYWRHPLLGLRLKACAQLVLDADAASAHAIFGSPDDLKLRSCMTLFAVAAPEEPVFHAVLERWFGGDPDPRTIELLAREGDDAGGV